LRRSSRRRGVETEAPPLATAHAYTVDLHRDEVALGRFVKRLSVSGAENIRVAYPEAGIVRISMEPPTTDPLWESTIGELVIRCGLRHAAASLSE
jgi:hypothetical protein